nr:DUF6285 domain-containing protein [uncultured Cupriavidus sp.]
MTEFVPEADRLLLAASDYLESSLLPTLEGYHRFQTRVCINVVRTVMRELQLRVSAEEGEQRRVESLLGTTGSLEELNTEMSSRLASGELPLDHPGLVDHLLLTLQDSLKINSPHWA